MEKIQGLYDGVNMTDERAEISYKVICGDWKVYHFHWGQSMYGGYYLDITFEDEEKKMHKDYYRCVRLTDLRYYANMMYELKLDNGHRLDN